MKGVPEDPQGSKELAALQGHPPPVSPSASRGATTMPPPSPFATLLQYGSSGPADSSAGTARAPSPLLVRTTAGGSRPASAASLHSADGSERAGRAAGSQHCGTRPGPRRSVVSESSTASITLEGVVSQVDAGCCDLRPPGCVSCMCCQFCAATAIAGQLAPPSCEASWPLLHRTPGNAVNTLRNGAVSRSTRAAACGWLGALRVPRPSSRAGHGSPRAGGAGLWVHR